MRLYLLPFYIYELRIYKTLTLNKKFAILPESFFKFFFFNKFFLTSDSGEKFKHVCNKVFEFHFIIFSNRVQFLESLSLKNV